jgi:hypothetical protein
MIPMAAMTTMSAVHKNMHERAEEQYEPGPTAREAGSQTWVLSKHCRREQK